ncbi:carbohydrate binding domain-containing protein [Paenibacillus swuensis]|uniref:carbohydrate binding domain-containing protein n=1 Tax=Paenibacillus swuensis TaxID=1178515 RepID=UPI000838B7AA|nr:carbohydrate binding domain-containing protein [Paenibacillus swuensis]
MLKKTGMLSFVVLFLLSACMTEWTPQLAQAEVSNESRFITRSGDKLMNGSEEFRFISWNVPSLVLNEDPVLHKSTAWEMEDAIRSVAQMGGQVIRIMQFTVKKSAADTALRFIHGRDGTGTMQYDESLFVNLDKAIQLCNQYGIRLIIPFTNDVEYFGGKAAFANLRGKTAEEFYTDPGVRQDFKEVMHHIMNRTNTYTNIKYKDDKAIMAWETGNELHAPDEWIGDIAAYFKSVNANQLFMDGNWGTLSEQSIEDPNVDILSNHYYSNTDLAGTADRDRLRTKGKKPLIIGEVGLTATLNMQKMFDKVIENGTSGAMIWSLRFHKEDGGYYQHRENSSYFSYHYPPILPTAIGYPVTNDQANVVRMVTDRAYRIQNREVPPIPVPEAPLLLPIQSVQKIAWRGSTGAESYTLERANTPDGPWSVVATEVVDSSNPYVPYQDATAVGGKSYYYRMTANNMSGASPYSNVAGPVPTVISSKENLLVNGGLELGTYGWSMENESNAITREGHRTGRTSLLLGPVNGTQTAKQSLKVKPKTNYKLTLYAKSDGGSARLQVTDVNQGVIGLGGTTDPANVTSISPSAEWKLHTLNFNSGNQEAVIVSLLNLSLNNNTYVDDAELKQDENYVMNAGFEAGLKSWSAGTSGAAVVSNEAKSGTASLKSGNKGGYASITQTMSVTPNTNYELSYYAKGQNPRAKVTTDPGLSNTVTNSACTVSATEWTRCTQSFNSGNFSTVYLTFYEGSTPTTMYIDDVDVRETPNTVANGGFEAGISPWVLGSGATISSVEKRTGINALKTGAKGNYTLSSQQITVKPGTQYTLNLYAKGQGGRYKVVSSDLGTTLMDVPVPSSTDWVKYTREFVSGTHSTLKVMLTEPGTAAITYFDDIEIIETPPAAAKVSFLMNGDFETGRLFPWLASGPVTVTTEERRLGLQSLKLAGQGEGETILSQDFDVEARKDYTISFYSKTSGGSAAYSITNVSGEVPVAEAVTLNIGGGWTYNTVNFNSGEFRELKLKVMQTNSTPIYLDEFMIGFKAPENYQSYNWFIDNFEVYGNKPDMNAALTGAWARNAGGGMITTTLDSSMKSGGDYGMKYSYDMGAKTYAGVIFGLLKNWYEYKGLSMWVQPDGSNNTLTVQFSDASGYGWESQIKLTGTTPRVVTIPFSEFKLASWVANRDAVLDLSSVTSFALYVGRSADGPAAGAIYFDDIQATQTIPVTGVSVTPESGYLEKGEDLALEARIAPLGAASQLVWSSGQPDIASVDAAGKVTAHLSGDATINVITPDGAHSANATVTVVDKSALRTELTVTQAVYEEALSSMQVRSEPVEVFGRAIEEARASLATQGIKQADIELAVTELKAAKAEFYSNLSLYSQLSGPVTVNADAYFSTIYGVSYVTQSVYQNVYVPSTLIQYDPEAVEFIGATSVKPGYEITRVNDTEPGRIQVLSDSAGSNGAVSGDTQLFELQWRAKIRSTNYETTIRGSSAFRSGVGDALPGIESTLAIQMIGVDKTTLIDLIAAVQHKLESAAEGASIGQYAPGSKAALHTELELAESVAGNEKSTQAHADEAAARLSAALNQFNNSVVVRKKEDVNGDSKTNLLDLLLILPNLGKNSAHVDWQRIVNCDVDGDLKISYTDLIMVIKQLNKS